MTMGNRKAAMEVLKLIDEFIPGSPNYAIQKERLEALNDKEFEAFMKKLQSGEECIPFYQPNMQKDKITVDRNLKLAKKLNHDFFERIWLTDETTGVTMLTPEKYMVIDLPIRRQQQLLIKKISIPQDNMHVDDLTGQPTGASKGSKLSFPELQVLYAMGLEESIEEMMKFRGGDEKAFRKLRQDIIETGEGNQESLRKMGTKVKATETLSTLLKAMHIDNTL